MTTPAKHLLFHGSIVLLVGLLCGIPYGIAIVRRKNEDLIRAWKLAHGSLSLGGATMLAIAGCISLVATPENLLWVVAIAYIFSGYGFCFAMVLEPFLGARGLSWRGTTENKIIYVGNSIGAWSSLVGTMALVFAAYLLL